MMKAPTTTLGKTVLVGTYRGDQLEKWPGWYCWPISGNGERGTGNGVAAKDAKGAKEVSHRGTEAQRDDEQTDLLTPNGVREDVSRVSGEQIRVLEKVTELWLFKGTAEQRNYRAEFVGVKTREELIRDYGYPAKGKAHGDRYALFRTEFLYRHENDLPEEADAVIVRLKDFATSPKVRKQLKAYLESPDRNDPDLAKLLPNVVTGIPPERLRVCEAGEQLEFEWIFRQQEIQEHIAIATVVAHKAKSNNRLTCVEICAGAGGQAIGLDMAGFEHVALVEYEPDYCAVLKANRPEWNVICGDVHQFDGKPYQGVDLFAGGVPCPPFSVASKQLGADDERDLFPEAIRLIGEIHPKAVMLENVRGFLDPKFDSYRHSILDSIARLGYRVNIKLLNASDYGVPQLRPRVVIVGIRNDIAGNFAYPQTFDSPAPTVGETLHELMAANGWKGADAWAARADKIAPTVVGGSKKHGGPDLGPARARRAWAELGVDGLGVANEAPGPDFDGKPRLTKEMLSRIQGFPEKWDFGHRKTLACRMIGNAFPPPVAQAVGRQIRMVLQHEKN